MPTSDEQYAARQEWNTEKYLRTSPEDRAKEPYTPFYRCVSYYRGEITREELLDVLSTWKYRPTDRTDGYDSLLVDVPGSFDDVEYAVRQDLVDSLDDEDYSQEGIDRDFYQWFPHQRKFVTELLARMNAAGNTLPTPAQYGTPDNPRIPDL